MRSIGDSPAILMKSYGVFTIGSLPKSALKSAIVAENAAKTYWLVLLAGELTILDEEEVAEHRKWYKTSYGQK